jgi:hypothetical protein
MLQACLQPSRDLFCTLFALEQQLSAHGCCTADAADSIITGIGGTIIEQQQEIDDRNLVWAESLAHVGALLGRAHSAAVLALDSALYAMHVPQQPCVHLHATSIAACAFLTVALRAEANRFLARIRLTSPRL